MRTRSRWVTALASLVALLAYAVLVTALAPETAALLVLPIVL